MNRSKFGARLVRSLFIALGTIYALTGVVFLSTGNPGGVSLGLLFLGGVALLYISLRLLDELRGIRQYLKSILGTRHESCFPSSTPFKEWAIEATGRKERVSNGEPY